MARIVGGVAASHTPTIGFAYDQHKQDDPAWAPIFKAFEPVQEWFRDKKPDALVYIFNDHVTSFFFDHYSAFTLGIGEEYPVADEGGSPRALPPIKGDPALNYDRARGEVKAPWLSWGPYLWARGTDKRSDGFSYEKSDFSSSDGTHESGTGVLKIGNQLLQFFKTDSTTKGWFVKNPH